MNTGVVLALQNQNISLHIQKKKKDILLILDLKDLSARDGKSISYLMPSLINCNGYLG